jgi:glycosyltransferase involved in cell wall biosynthesis
VLIIDDASPDNTAEVAKDLAAQDARVTFVRHTENKGHIATYNEGIEWATADYMLLLSADDYLLPDAFERVVAFMDAHSCVGFTFGNVLAKFSTGMTKHVLPIATTKHGWRIFSGEEFITISGARDIVSTPTAVVRTELQKRLGGYRPELPHSGDMEMWLRFAAHSSVGFLNAYQAVYRRHDQNMSNAYFSDCWLPDVKERQAAFACFFEHCGHRLSDPNGLRQKLTWLLACDAISFASEAFNQQKMDVHKQLRQFAVALCPEVVHSFTWSKLAYKERVGHTAWRKLRPVINGARVLMSSVRRTMLFGCG